MAETSTRRGVRVRLRLLGRLLREGAQAEELDWLFRQPEPQDWVRTQTVRERERLLRRGLIRPPHGQP